MASIFFDKIGVTFFYICLAVYLYGDLSIYGAAVAKSLADIACTYQSPNLTCNDTIPDSDPCWEGSIIDRLNAYRIFLVRKKKTKEKEKFRNNIIFIFYQTLFVVSLGPFVFFNIQKTKYLQLLTSGMRWLAFTIMIAYASRILIVEGPQGSPVASNVAGE